PDSSVVASDAVAVINYINAFGSGPVPENAVIGEPFGFVDTIKDNNISPNDVLEIINFINANGAGLTGPAGEGEGLAPQSFDDLITLLAADMANEPARRRRA